MSNEITLKLENGGTIVVDAEVLSSESPIFNDIINNYHQTNIDLDDFGPEAAVVFIRSLQSKTFPCIDQAYFRDLHKISFVFNVSWMIRNCQEYLKDLIVNVQRNDYHQQTFLFEEAMYIMAKWNIRRFMDHFVHLMRNKDYIIFIIKFCESFHSLSNAHLNQIMNLSIRNPEVVIRLLLNHTKKIELFDKNTRYIIENINLPFCIQINFDLCYDLFDSLMSFKNLNKEECSFLWKLQSESTRLYFKRQQDKPKQLQPDNKPISQCDIQWRVQLNQPTEYQLDDDGILDFAVGLASNQSSMIKVLFIITFILEAAIWKPSLMTNITNIVGKLEQLAEKNNWKRVNCELIHMLQPGKIKQKCWKLDSFLDALLESTCLASYNDSMKIVCEVSNRIPFGISVKDRLNTTADSTLRIKHFMASSFKYPFKFRHPSIRNCSIDGDCGFLVRVIPGETRLEYKLELVTDESDYPADLHYHNVITGQDMLCVFTCKGYEGEDRSQTFEYYLGCWKPCFKTPLYSPKKDEVQQLIVFYDVSHYLTTKPPVR